MDEQSLEDIQRDASQIIAIKMAEVFRILQECEVLAMETGVGFRFDHVWGMGGYFDGEEGWQPSSQSC